MKELLKEWNKYLNEFYFHDPDTGHFTSKKPGVVKSLTKSGAKRRGIDTKYAERGVVTANDKVSAKFGMNGSREQSCGRKQISGDDIPAKYKCSDYKKLYEDEFNLDEIERWMTLLEDGDQEEACDKCVRAFLLRVQKANAALSQAQKGTVKRQN